MGDIGGPFDAALLMGPLYHLVESEDRKHALVAVSERLKTGCTVFTAWISRFGIMGDLIKNLPAWIEREEEVEAILDEGRNPFGPRAGFRGYFTRVEEIVPAHEAVGFKALVLAGVEPAISADDESYNKLQGSRREKWLDVLFRLSLEPSIIAASRHLLYIGRKAADPGA